jgi:hypothetical protein
MEQAPQSTAQALKEFRYYNSFSLPLDVQVGISRLELPLDVSVTDPEVPQDVYFTAYVVCNQMPMHESPGSTFFPIVDPSRNALLWDYVMTFPLRMRDLSADALLVLTAWTPDGRVLGGTTMNFFDENGCMKRGKQKLMFYFGTIGDPNAVRSLNTTTGENYSLYAKWDHRFKLEKELEAFNSNQSATNRSRGEAKSDWLDRLTFTQLQACLQGRTADGTVTTAAADGKAPAEKSLRTWGRSVEELELESFCFLIVDLPLLQYPVGYLFHHNSLFPLSKRVCDFALGILHPALLIALNCCLDRSCMRRSSTRRSPRTCRRTARWRC